MLVLARQIHHLRYLGFRDFVSEDTADPDTTAMHMQHDARRLLSILLEKPLQDVNDELHRRVIIVQHQYFVHGGLLGARARLHDDARLRPFTTTLPVIWALILIAHALGSVFQKAGYHAATPIGYGANGRR